MLGYKVFTTAGLFGGCAGDFGRRLRGQGELHLLEQEQQLWLRLGVAGQNKLAPIDGTSII